MSLFDDIKPPLIQEDTGCVHPINYVKDYILQILSDFGFAPVLGPEIESEKFNFDMLNIPKFHPARQMHDTFYVEKKTNVLRTHTSPVQIRTMLKSEPPFAYASAGNYLKNMGWNYDSHCFYKINLNKDISKKYLNISAKELLNKKKLKYFKKYISNYKDLSFIDENLIVAIITPDKDIVSNADTLSPAYVVFDNYEIILKWNRSLRFALAVCTLKDNIKNEF